MPYQADGAATLAADAGELAGFARLAFALRARWLSSQPGPTGCKASVHHTCPSDTANSPEAHSAHVLMPESRATRPTTHCASGSALENPTREVGTSAHLDWPGTSTARPGSHGAQMLSPVDAAT